MRTSSDSRTSTTRTQRTIETNTDNIDELSDDQYIRREILQQRLQNLFTNLDNIQAQLLQQSLPSYKQRVNEARQDLTILEAGIGNATRITEAARMHLINATTNFTNITLQHTMTLNHTILPIVQRLLQTRIAQCQENINQF